MEQTTLQRVEKKGGAGPNLTGIPTQMKLDYERRSGLSFDDVRVHYNSDKPAQLQALAYTQGRQVYVGPGQERHLPHELGHVVQQKLGLVRPTARLGNIPINNSNHMEQMADRFRTGNIQGAGASGLDEDVIQYAGGIGVTLALIYDQEELYDMEEVIVETIKFGERPNTGRGHQGAHSLSLKFIQKYQQHMNKGKTLFDAFKFYKNFVSDVIWDIRATNDIEAWEDSQRLAKTAEQMIDELDYDPEFPLSKWSVYFGKVVEFANNAYARGPLATQGVGSKGLGESGGIRLLGDLKRGKEIDISRMFANLIDVKSAEQINERFGKISFATQPVPDTEDEEEQEWVEKLNEVRSKIEEIVRRIGDVSGESMLRKTVSEDDAGGVQEENTIEETVESKKIKVNLAIHNANDLVNLLSSALENNEIGRVELRYVWYLSDLLEQYKNGMPESVMRRSILKENLSRPNELLELLERLEQLEQLELMELMEQLKQLELMDNYTWDLNGVEEVKNLEKISPETFTWDLYHFYQMLLDAIDPKDEIYDEADELFLNQVKNIYSTMFSQLFARWDVLTETYLIESYVPELRSIPFIELNDPANIFEMCQMLINLNTDVFSVESPLTDDDLCALCYDIKSVMEGICAAVESVAEQVHALL